jgi:hypothetical protein
MLPDQTDNWVVRYDILVRDIALFIALYLSLYVAFFLGIYTLARSYKNFFAAVEQSPLPDMDKVGCRFQKLTDITYVLFTLSFGDNLGDVLAEGRQDATNICGGLEVFKSTAEILLSFCTPHTFTEPFLH